MSLLSALLDHMPPTIVGNESPKMASRPTRLHLVLADRAQTPNLRMSPPHASAATATPQWRNARDHYLNHIMICRSCYAPTRRHCAAGADLRAAYVTTPMEAHP